MSIQISEISILMILWGISQEMKMDKSLISKLYYKKTNSEILMAN